MAGPRVVPSVDLTDFDVSAVLTLGRVPEGLGPRGVAVKTERQADGSIILVHNWLYAWQVELDRRQSPSPPEPAWWTSSWAGCWQALNALAQAPASEHVSRATAFAAKYGLLGLCEHPPAKVAGNRLPAQYMLQCPECAEEMREHKASLGGDIVQHGLDRRAGTACSVCDWREPLSAWVQCAKQVRAIVRVANASRQGDPVKNEDGLALWGPQWNEYRNRLGVEETYSHVVGLLDKWLQLGQVSLILSERDAWTPAPIVGPGVALVGSGVLTNVALQLAALITSKDQVLFCDAVGCGNVAREGRTRRARPGKHVLCEAHERQHKNTLKNQSRVRLQSQLRHPR